MKNPCSEIPLGIPLAVVPWVQNQLMSWMEKQMPLIGAKFDYLGKTWIVTKLSKTKIYFQSGTLKSDMELHLFPKFAENIRRQS